MRVLNRKAAETSLALTRDLDARFRAPLMSFFRRRTDSYAEAEDLTQKTFVRLIASTSFESANGADAYVFRVAINLLRDRARHRVRWSKIPTIPLDSTAGDKTSAEYLKEIDPERILIGRTDLGEALACLDELGERSKSIFIL